jgi:hypothetical protein
MFLEITAKIMKVFYSDTKILCFFKILLLFLKMSEIQLFKNCNIKVRLQEELAVLLSLQNK